MIDGVQPPTPASNVESEGAETRPRSAPTEGNKGTHKGDQIPEDRANSKVPSPKRRHWSVC